jgi:hypothetical protein
MSTQTEAATIYRLTDIDTEEVSIVDRAANKRKFLVVKGHTMQGEIVSDGKGGHTVAKETPTAPVPDASATPTTPATPASEPVLQLSPEAKIELSKRLDAAAARMAALKTLVASAVEVPGLVEVPSEIATAVAELLTGISHGEMAKGDPVAKGLPQFSGARTNQLQAAYDALGAVLGSLSKPSVAETPAAPVPEINIEELVAKSVAKALTGLEAKVASGLEKVAGVVAKQGEAIAKQAAVVEIVQKSTRATPRAGVSEGAQEVATAKADDLLGSWPTDMADPDKHDVTKVDPTLRFTKR